MAKSAILAVRIIGDSSGASKAMSGAGSSASALAAKFGAVSGIVSGAVQGMTSHAIDYVKNLSGEMVATSDSAQSFANTLSFAGVDDSKIKSLTKSTQKYADQTVFSLSDIRNTTAQLASNGVQGYAELAEAAGNLTAVAGGGADAYRSVGLVLTQTAAAGKLTTENWNQLSDAIPGASGRLQEAMKANGAYTGNFRDAMAKGEISADEFNQALMQLGMSDAAKKAANDTSQMSNASGNLEASVVKLGAGFLDLVKPEVTGFMAGLADWVSNLADGLPGLSGKVQGLAGDLEGRLGSAVDWVKTQGGQAFQALKDSAGPVLDGLKSSVKGVSDVVRPFTSAFGLAGAAISGSMPNLDPWNKLRDALTTAGHAMGELGQFASQHAGVLQTVAVMAGAAAAAYVVWNGAISVHNTVTGLATGVQAAFNAVMDANPIMLVVMAIAAITAGLVYFFTQTQTGQQQWAAFTGFLGSTITNVKAWFGQAGDWVTGKWQGVQAFFSGLPGAIGGFFAGIGSWLSSPFVAAGNAATAKWDSVKAWFAGIPGAIGGFFSNAGSLLWNAGSSIISGLWDGLKSKWEDVKNWVGGLGDWIKEHKGPPAYDAKLLTGNGELIMGSLYDGLDRGWTRKVRPYLGNVTREIPKFGASSLGNSGVAIGAGRPTVITINVNGPVLDGYELGKRCRKALDAFEGAKR
ncbi:tape measure protein [Bifidobacterium sp. ESL0769]|uniref:tape measure protein n=1 Tax=Bifidobacterium sp. ESL0769 TaxID=2983229 RepID=UPI0023F71471|nr:tape measure protein [Bifidobacterium sp. ESL0769]WEV67971.1 tape measure protein [Bifidobacterium sp. ESL0769]